MILTRIWRRRWRRRRCRSSPCIRAIRNWMNYTGMWRRWMPHICAIPLRRWGKTGSFRLWYRRIRRRSTRFPMRSAVSMPHAWLRMRMSPPMRSAAGRSRQICRSRICWKRAKSIWWLSASGAETVRSVTIPGSRSQSTAMWASASHSSRILTIRRSTMRPPEHWRLTWSGRPGITRRCSSCR